MYDALRDMKGLFQRQNNKLVRAKSKLYLLGKLIRLGFMYVQCTCHDEGSMREESW